MKTRKSQTVEQTSAGALADHRTLSIIIARIKFFVSSAKDRKQIKKYNQLISVLEKLTKIQRLAQLLGNSLDSAEQMPFVDGIPRWVIQAEAQFHHYVNPPGKFRTEWAKKRSSIWNAFEESIPDPLRETLLSWRWRAELSAFRRIKDELIESQKKLRQIEEKLDEEEKRSERMPAVVGLIDRLRIIKWSKTAVSEESKIAQLEQEKQRKLNELAEVLGECEHLAASIAMEMKSSFVDCGDFYPTVFEECTRALDNEVRKELTQAYLDLSSETDVLKKVLEERRNFQDVGLRKKTSTSEKINRVLNNDWERKLADAQELIQQEFLCLNSLELEQQEEARNRWMSAVENMKSILQTAEENLLHVRSHN